MWIEDKNCEFKRCYTDDIKKTVIAFANTSGGILYIGIEDDGTVSGVPNIDDVILQSTNSIRNSIKPDVTLFTDATVENRDGKSVIAISVQQGTARPYYLTGKGIRPEGVFVRQGASTVPATEAAILSMIKETAGDSYESARALNQQPTFHTAAAFFEEKQIAFGKAQMKSLGLIGEDDMYTNVALLLSDQCPHGIKLAVFEGTDKSTFKDRQEFAGPLFSQLEDVYASIDRYNRTRSEFPGLYRIDKRDYPPQALRETLLNAIVHRDYAYSASILVSIFDDRMEIVSVGGLVKGISLEDIKLGLSIPRNPHLASIFYRLNLIEAYGAGIPKIWESYRGSGYAPTMAATANAFKVILPNMNVPLSAQEPEPPYVADEREAMVLRLLSEKESITRKDVETVTEVSQPTAVTLLRKMLDKKLIFKTGKGKLVRYHLKK